MIEKIVSYFKEIIKKNRFVEKQTEQSGFNRKFYLQLSIAFAFFVLSVANVIAKSYVMLIFTAVGFLSNAVAAFIAKKYCKGRICAYTSIITCSLLFAFFVVTGGNQGFACLWVTLLPFLAMVAMDFVMGLCASVFFQIYLIVVFWTPVRDLLSYAYNEQFCLRFPLFFFVTFLLGFLLTVSMHRSQYNECTQMVELEKLTEAAYKMARIDSLTALANRRCAYERFEKDFAEEGSPHCLVMCDIDFFKKINDTYGHELGDDVLRELAKLFKESLPDNYLKSRWGGEEFLFAANEPIDKVYAHIEELRKKVEKHEFRFGENSVQITLTFGIAEYRSLTELDGAISLADNRLYLGKENRNCTIGN